MNNLRFSGFLCALVLALFALSGQAQIKLQSYTTATDTFYWKRYIRIPKPEKISLSRYTVSGPTRVIDAFLAKNLEQFPLYAGDSLPKFTISRLKKSLYPIDINGDNLPDIVFSGFAGGESDMVRIYLNRKDSFELVFEDYQYFTRFRKAAGKLVEFQTGDVGFGDNYLYFTRDYRVQQESDGPVFVKVKQHVTYKNTEEPTRYYPLPIACVAKTDTLLLRASAAMLNEPFDPRLETFGNIVAKYRKKARGVALASKSYGKGNDWYFIELYPDATPAASILYDLTRMPAFIRGWVSGQSIFLDLK